MLVTSGGGYALKVPDPDLDATRFHDAVTAANHEVAPVQVLGEGHDIPVDRLSRALDSLDEALGWWRGTPYLELADVPAAAAERGRLERLRLMAHEDRALTGLALGRHATVAADLEVLTADHPLHERLWALRAVALARSGRQADALDTLRQVRTLLADELGIEPGAELRAVQAAVLRQDLSVSTGSALHTRMPRSDRWWTRRRGPCSVATTPCPHSPHCWTRRSPEPLASPPWSAHPGIGKSRLVDELAQLAQSAGVDGWSAAARRTTALHPCGPV